MLFPVGKLIYNPDRFVINIDMSHKEFEVKLKGFCELSDFGLKRGTYGDLYGYVLISGEDPVAWITVKETVVYIDPVKYSIYTYSDEKIQQMLEVRADTDGKSGGLLAQFFREIFRLFYVGKEVKSDSLFIGLTSPLYWKNLSPPQDTDYSEFVPPFVRWNEIAIKSNAPRRLDEFTNIGVNQDTLYRNQMHDDEVDMTTNPNEDWVVLLKCQTVTNINIPTQFSKILFIAANPTDTTRLRLGKEFDEINAELERGTEREKVTLVLPKLATQSKDLTRALLREAPTLVHFSGHGESSGAICFETEDGKSKPVSAAALGSLFEQFKDKVQCVILNACYSATQAQAIAKHIPYVIGMSHAIPDAHAIAFSIGFYQAIANGATIEKAYALGKVQIGLS